MGIVESVFAGDDGDDVAIVNGTQFVAGEIDVLFRDEAADVARVFALQARNFAHALRMVAQHGIGLGVAAHIVKIDVEGLREIRGENDLFNGFASQVISHPKGQVVQARGVTGHVSVEVAQAFQVAAVIGKSAFAFTARHGQCRSGFDERGAVETAEVDH